jgi:hypothetical protein
MRHNNNSATYTQGQTLGGSNLQFTASSGNYLDTAGSGTWRVMGVKTTGGSESQTTVWLRIS